MFDKRIRPAFLSILLFSSCLAGQVQAGNSAPQPTATPIDVFADALRLYRTGKLDAAATKYRALLQQNSKSGEAYAGLVRTYLRQQKVAQADATAGQGIKEASDSTVVRTAMGEVYFREGKIQEAETEFQNVLNSTSGDARACWGLARVSDARSLHATAKKLLQKAHTLDPEDPDIQRDWMDTLQLGEKIKVLESYLSGETDDDAEERETLRHHLDLIKVLIKRPPMQCELVDPVSSGEIEIRPIFDGPQQLRGYGIDVKINARTSHLLFDTGASHLLLSKKVAEKAGVERLSGSEVRGVGDEGESGGYFGYAASIKVGQLEFHDCLIRVSEKRSVAEEDGLIGADLFSHYLVTLDFPKNRLRLSELPERPEKNSRPASIEDDSTPDSQALSLPGMAQAEASTSSLGNSAPRDAYVALTMQSYAQVFRFGHMLLIPTRLGESSPRLFLIDTGASSNTATPETARGARVSLTGDVQVSGVNGNVKSASRIEDAVLQFAQVRQENQGLFSFDLSHVSKNLGIELSGTLGIRLLKLFVVNIDYRDGLVNFSKSNK